ncbi:MAG: hypothetical protein IJT96_08565 [Lachnospiraceae bacterium]|nr:hypothetical protein [Lachnospiraceae bacterium]
MSEISYKAGIKNVEFINENETDELFIPFKGSSFPDVRGGVFLSDKRYLPLMDSDSVCMVVTLPELAQDVLNLKKGVCITSSPKEIFYKCHNYIARRGLYNRHRQETVVGRECRIEPDARVASENVIIGDNVIIGSGVKIYENTFIGSNVQIDDGVIIGNRAFDVRNFGGKPLPLFPSGGVKICDGVQIFSNCYIDRATFPSEFTEIGEDSILGVGCHIGHAVHIGSRVQMVAQSLVAGYTLVGDDVSIGTNVFIADRLKIGEGVSISAGSVVVTNVGKGTHMTGNYAMEHSEFIKEYARKKM